MKKLIVALMVVAMCFGTLAPVAQASVWGDGGYPCPIRDVLIGGGGSGLGSTAQHQVFMAMDIASIINMCWSITPSSGGGWCDVAAALIMDWLE